MMNLTGVVLERKQRRNNRWQAVYYSPGKSVRYVDLPLDQRSTREEAMAYAEANPAL